ncbi:DNA-protecting protein DprA [Candidatus Daviesbacteria bacterium]|nr:DNA-protecting protein DprA [Candidatus Daviesbacteria bacterium]
MNNIPYLLALHSIDGLGPIRLKALIEYFKDPKLAWEADLKQIREIGIPQSTVELLVETRKKLDPEKYAQSISNSGIKWLTIFDEEYPKLLKEIYDPPIVLYYKGEILPKDDKAIAIVGTRKMTGYGKAVTEQFTQGLVDGGLTIVSGLARGVDSLAHQTVLKEDGRTIAVLGGGLNYIFPPENTELANKISQGFGAIISEFPPNYPSLAGNFPARNRIISGLSLAVLVTEAAEDSGSLITARLALEQGREVFAVPGPITSTLSKGPIDLIKEGAKVVTDPQEILDDLGISQGVRVKVKGESELELSDDEKKILDYLENETRHIDEVCRSLNLSAAQVSASLVKMEIKGIVRNLGNGIYTEAS